MIYDFDQAINRNNTGSRKWDMPGEDNDGILPMWVADMDFKSPQEVIDAFVKRSKHGVFGYTYRDDEFYNSIINWCKKRYNWEVEKEWIIFIPGVVMGLNIGVMQLTKPGEKVMIQTPVYPPFKNVIINKDRIPLEASLIEKEDKYIMDFDYIRKNIDGKTKLFMLCSPHNPVGRVWSKKELLDLGDILLEKNIPIISDEIHADFVYKNYKHYVLASLSEKLKQNTITLLSPSKTFNIAGLGTSVAIIPNENLRNKYKEAIDYMGVGTSNIFGVIGLTEAYRHGENWLNQLLIYLEENLNFAMDFIKENIPNIRVKRPEGTYLLWLDFREFNKSADEIYDILIKVGKIRLNDGRSYGKEGEKFFRLNIATQREKLEKALIGIQKSVNSLI